MQKNEYIYELKNGNNINNCFKIDAVIYYQSKYILLFASYYFCLIYSIDF